MLFLGGLLLFPWSAAEPLNVISASVAEIIRLPLTAISLADRTLTSGWAMVGGLIDLYGENQQLQEELLRLRVERNSLKEMAAEAERYRAVFEFQQHCPYPTVVAQVIGRNPTNWHRTLIIAKGRRDGVVEGLGVVTPLGVIGRVLKVHRTFSIVQLVLDRDNAITAVVQRTRDEGIVQGTEDGRATLKYIPPLSSIKAGDVVVTSGLDDRFPKGMLIGVVDQVEQKVATPFKSASLTSYADFSRLEEVIVLLAIALPEGQGANCYTRVDRSEDGG